MIEERDVVALTVDRPDDRLLAGHQGTVIEKWSQTEFSIEFVDILGETYAIIDAKVDELLKLRELPLTKPGEAWGDEPVSRPAVLSAAE